jgi:hypothetical protein
MDSAYSIGGGEMDYKLDMDVGSIFAQKKAGRKIGEFLFQTPFWEGGGEQRNFMFVENSIAIANEDLMNMLPSYTGVEILKASLGSDYRKRYHVSLVGGSAGWENEKKVFQQLQYLSTSDGINGRDRVKVGTIWILICNYGYKNEAEYGTGLSKGYTLTSSEIIYGQVSDSQRNFYLGGVVKNNEDRDLNTIGNDWYLHLTKGDEKYAKYPPRWLKAISKYRPQNSLNYTDSSQKDWNMWAEEHLQHSYEPLIDIQLFTVTPKTGNDGMGVFNWWW